MKATAGASSVIGCTLRGLPSVIGGLKVTRSGGRKFDPPARGSRRLRVDSEERPTIDRHPATTDDRIVSTRLLVVAQTRVRDQLAAHAARVADRRRVLSDVPGRRLHLPRDDEARRSGRHADLHELSPEALPPLGIAFALVAALPTGDFEHHQRSSQTTVNDEASSLRAAVLLVHSVSRASEAKKRFLIARHIDQRGGRNWPPMTTNTPAIFGGVVRAGLRRPARARCHPSHRRSDRGSARTRQLARNDLNARRQWMTAVKSQLNWVKWTTMIVLGCVLLLAIAFLCERRATTGARAGGARALALGRRHSLPDHEPARTHSRAASPVQGPL